MNKNKQNQGGEDREEFFRLRVKPEDKSASRIAYRTIGIATRSHGFKNTWRKAKGQSKVTITKFHQRAVVKNRIATNKGGASSKNFRNALSKHLNYIERESAQKDQQKGEMYNQHTDGVDKKEFLEQAQNDPRNFRLILSPDKVHNGNKSLDMKEYTREFMDRVQRDLGTKVDWVAVNHFNTEHPHSHIIMRGLDEDGKELIIKPEYLQHGMREQAQSVATSKLGLRSYNEIEQQLMKEVSLERVTGFDRSIDKRLDENRSIDLQISNDKQFSFSHQLMIGRCQRLEELGLAVKDESGKPVWKVHDNFLDILKERGQRNDIYKHLEKTNSLDIHIYNPEKHGRQYGHIIETDIHNELDDSNYHVVQAHNGNAFYVKGHRYGLGLPEAKTGDYVRLDSHYESMVKERADNNILRVTNNGELPYTKDAHRLDYQDYYSWKHEKDIEAFEQSDHDSIERHVNAHEKRLERLARHDLVEKLPDGSFKVPGDLSDQVERLDQKLKKDAQRWPHVFHQSSHQLHPTTKEYRVHWLDKVMVEHNGIPQSSRFGFGKDFDKAIHSRLAFLKESGLLSEKNGKLSIDFDKMRQKGVQEYALAFKEKNGFELEHNNDKKLSGTYEKTVRIGDEDYAIIRNRTRAAIVPRSKYMNKGQQIDIQNIRLAQQHGHHIQVKPKSRNLSLGYGL